MSLEDALSRKKGEPFKLHHSELRNFTANQLTEVCYHVRIGLQLRPVTDEVFNCNSTNTAKDNKFDVLVRKFCVRAQMAFPDSRIFDPLAI